MPICQITSHLIHIRFDDTGGHHLNAYLWLDEDGVTLIDTGTTSSAQVLRGALRRVGRKPADVQHIVLTHFHEDHTGSAAQMVELTDATVIAGRADARFIRGQAPGPAPALTEAESRLFPAGAAGFATAAPCPVDVEVVDGHQLTIARGAEVLAVPGHTPGSIALFLPQHRVLFTGDTVAESEGRVVLGPLNVDRTRAWESLQRLAALDVEIACPGHGDPLVGGASTRLRGATDPLG